MIMRLKALVVAVFVALGAVPAVAQDVKIETPPPRRELRDAPGAPAVHDRGRPSDHEYYPNGPRVGHDPGFIEPLSSEYESGNTTGRVGVSGWTAPNAPLGPEVVGYKENTGWFGFGFTVTWGGPPRPQRRPAQ